LVLAGNQTCSWWQSSADHEELASDYAGSTVASRRRHHGTLYPVVERGNVCFIGVRRHSSHGLASYHEDRVVSAGYSSHGVDHSSRRWHLRQASNPAVRRNVVFFDNAGGCEKVASVLEAADSKYVVTDSCCQYTLSSFGFWTCVVPVFLVVADSFYSFED